MRKKYVIIGKVFNLLSEIVQPGGHLMSVYSVWKILLACSVQFEIARARAVLSYLAVRPNRMKTTKAADFLNVSQSAISKCLLSGEKEVKENNGIIDETLK